MSESHRQGSRVARDLGDPSLLSRSYSWLSKVIFPLDVSFFPPPSPKHRISTVLVRSLTCWVGLHGEPRTCS